MKLFVSWSEETSLKIAEAFRWWIPRVLQSVDVWISSKDIAHGLPWASELFDALGECRFGLLCVTPESLASSYMMFEAGALAKSVPDAYIEGRVVPVLFGVTPSDLIGTPLTHFQAVTEPSRERIGELMLELNRLTDSPIGEEQLKETLDTWWPSLQERLPDVTARERTPTAPSMLSAETAVLNELLQSVRSQERRLERLAQSAPIFAPLSVEDNQRSEAFSTATKRTVDLVSGTANRILTLLMEEGYSVTSGMSTVDGQMSFVINRNVGEDTTLHVDQILREEQTKLPEGPTLRVLYTYPKDTPA